MPVVITTKTATAYHKVEQTNITLSVKNVYDGKKPVSPVLTLSDLALRNNRRETMFSLIYDNAFAVIFNAIRHEITKFFTLFYHRLAETGPRHLNLKYIRITSFKAIAQIVQKSNSVIRLQHNKGKGRGHKKNHRWIVFQFSDYKYFLKRHCFIYGHTTIRHTTRILT